MSRLSLVDTTSPSSTLKTRMIAWQASQLKNAPKLNDKRWRIIQQILQSRTDTLKAAS